MHYSQINENFHKVQVGKFLFFQIIIQDNFIKFTCKGLIPYELFCIQEIVLMVILKHYNWWSSILGKRLPRIYSVNCSTKSRFKWWLWWRVVCSSNVGIRNAHANSWTTTKWWCILCNWFPIAFNRACTTFNLFLIWRLRKIIHASIIIFLIWNVAACNSTQLFAHLTCLLINFITV